MPTLIVHEPLEKEPRPVLLRPGTAVTIGRNPQNTIAVHDVYLSGFHGRIDIAADGAAVLTDVSSRSGTSVNNAPIGGQPYRLHDGDRIRMGFTDFVFQCDASEEPS